MPNLALPHGISVIIQEESANAHGATDLFEGRIEDLGHHADLIEAVAPPWLAEVLLKVGPVNCVACSKTLTHAEPSPFPGA